MNFIDFIVSGQNINLDKITSITNVIPKYLHKKGDIYCDKYTKKSITYSENCWIANIEVDNFDEIEKKTHEFVDLFYKNKEYIKQLLNECTVTLWITLYQETNQYNLHFSRETLSKIVELGIGVDITIMQLQEFYNN